VASVTGVLPAPPAITLPTTMVGMPGCTAFFQPHTYSLRCSPDSAPYTAANGHKARAARLRLRQIWRKRSEPVPWWAGALMGAALFFAGRSGGLGGKGNLRQTCTSRSFHGGHHGLVRGCRIGADDDNAVGTRWGGA